MPNTVGLSPIHGVASQLLIERYRSLHEALSALWAAPVPDKAAVDRTMNEIDTVHAQLKAFNSRPDDQQTY